MVINGSIKTYKKYLRMFLLYFNRFMVFTENVGFKNNVKTIHLTGLVYNEGIN